MTVNPNNVQEAHTIMLATLLGTKPHVIKYEASEEDWDERIRHLLKIANAIDAYVLALGHDCRSNAHIDLDMGAFTDIVGNALDDALGQMQQGAIAAREHETETAG